MKRGVLGMLEVEAEVDELEVGLVDLAAAFADFVVMGAILGVLGRRRCWC